MPFNVSGVFSRLHNWVTDRDNSIKIMAARMDAEADDTAAAINAIVGQSRAFINPVKAPSGTVALPAFSFENDPNTGAYNPAADEWAVATNGVRRVRVSTTGVEVDLPITGAAFTINAPLSGSGLSKVGGVRATVGGTANAITLTAGIGAVVLGTQVRFRATGSNSGHATINLDGVGAITCLTPIGTILTAGFIRTDVDTVATYDGFDWVLERSVERGSNANGQFTRFEDGTQICTKRLTGLGPINTALGSGFVSGNISVGSWAAAFSAAPEVSGSGIGNSTHVLTGSWVSAPTATIGGATQLIRFVTSAATDYALSIIAIGRWY